MAADPSRSRRGVHTDPDYEVWTGQIGRQSIGACGLAGALSRVLPLFVRASPFAISHESLTNRGAGV